MTTSEKTSFYPKPTSEIGKLVQWPEVKTKACSMPPSEIKKFAPKRQLKNIYILLNACTQNWKVCPTTTTENKNCPKLTSEIGKLAQRPQVKTTC